MLIGNGGRHDAQLYSYVVYINPVQVIMDIDSSHVDLLWATST